MDDMGVYAQVCYQNSGVTQAGSLMALGDPELALKIIQIYNDASAEYQQDSGQRIFNMAHLPFWNQRELEKEARRCIDMGAERLRGCPTPPERVGVPSFLQEYWTPFLELCNDTGTPPELPPQRRDRPQYADLGGLCLRTDAVGGRDDVSLIGNAATLGNWNGLGRLDRHPKLKIA